MLQFGVLWPPTPHVPLYPNPSLILAHTHTHTHRNLLRPSGVRLVPATMNIRILRGEDLPQMDAGYFEGVKKFLHVGTVQKELVDPYCTVAFAGHKGKTQVIWNEQDPEWNHQINLGVKVHTWWGGWVGV